jgi:hypothetical protein
MMRKKFFLNTDKEIVDESMTEALQDGFGPSLLSSNATTELKGRVLNPLAPTIEQWIVSTGHEWQEVDLIDWCRKLIFELSNKALFGGKFLNDEMSYRDILYMDDFIFKAWMAPEFMLSQEHARMKKLIERTKKTYGGGIDSASIIRSRLDVCPLL